MRKMDFGNKWWTELWLHDIEAEDPARMARGKAYARQGKVVDLKIKTHKVNALVKGQTRQAYAVSFIFAPVTEMARQRLQSMIEQAGAVPEPLAHWETLLKQENLSMIPTPLSMSMDCSCPDWSWPCKHAAAVACLLSVRMEKDPWLLLKLQGIDASQITQHNEADSHVVQELPLDAHSFWGRGLESPLNLELSQQNVSVLDELGSLGDGLSRRKLKQSLEPVYEKSRLTAARWLSEFLHVHDADSEWLKALPPDEH